MSKVTDPRYGKSYGRWIVTTEGDCEGRSTRQLGTHEGFLDDIAFALADRCYYSLNFRPADDLPPGMPATRDSVQVQLDINSGTWDMSKDDRVKFVADMLKDHPGTKTLVRDGTAYASVTLRLGINEEERKEMERQRHIRSAKNKLSADELEALGLKD